MLHNERICVRLRELDGRVVAANVHSSSTIKQTASPSRASSYTHQLSETYPSCPRFVFEFSPDEARV